MPRTLPWLHEKKDEGRVKQEYTPRKRVKREADADPDLTPKPPASPGRKDFMRSCTCQIAIRDYATHIG